MSFDISLQESRHLKQFSKKYLPIREDTAALPNSPQKNLKQSSVLGVDCVKIHLNISSKHAGERGDVQLGKITLPDIYDKSDKNTITDKELADLLKQVPE